MVMNVRLVQAIAGIIIASLLCLASAHAQDARTVAKNVTPSVVLLVMQDANGQPISMGSGFVIRDGVVATNLHVIAGASSGYAKLIDQKDKLAIQGTVGIDAAHDLALVSVAGLKVQPLTLGDSTKVATGDEVYAVGNPQGLEGTFSTGIVSGVRKIGNDSLLQITAPISPGSSGGPVTNAKGEVIGISVATFKDGQNLNFAIPSSYVVVLLGRMTAVAKFADAKALGAKTKSVFDDLGGKSTDGVEGGSFTWDNVIQSGGYSFSIRSKLQSDVRNVFCLVVFYDEAGSAIDVAVVQYPDLLPAGLAKRVKGHVDASVEKLNTKIPANTYPQPPRTPKGKIELRILYFQPSDSDKPADEKPAPIEPRSDTQQKPTANGQADAADRLRDAQDKLADSVAAIAPAGNGPELIEDQIEGEFEGWTGETIFKLSNGQIWQQVTYAYIYHYAFRPKVMIVKVRGAYRMHVDGVDSMIYVKQLK